MVPVDRPSVTIVIVSVLLALNTLSCRSDIPLQVATHTVVPSENSAKVIADPLAPQGLPRGERWAGHPKLFISNLRVASIAATPTRMLATTLGQAMDKIVTISETGEIQTFTFEFQAAKEQKCYLEIASGHNPALPVGEVYVTLESDIWRLDADGSNLVKVATLPSQWGAVAGICFDRHGDFNYGLLVLTQSGAVFLLDGVAPFHQVGFLGPGGRGPSIASAGFGTHAGQLIAAFPEENVMRALDASGRRTTVIGWSGVSNARAIPQLVRNYGRSMGSLFVAVETGEVYRFPAQEIAAFKGHLIATSQYRSGNGVISPQGTLYSSKSFSRFTGSEVFAAFVESPAITVVQIDVLPRDSTNQLMMGAAVLVPVGILSTPYFSVTSINLESLSLSGSSPVSIGMNGMGRYSDLNGDGDRDVTVYFDPVDLQWNTTTSSVLLEGNTMTGERVEGRDQVRVVLP